VLKSKLKKQQPKFHQHIPTSSVIQNVFIKSKTKEESRDISVGIALGYGLDDRGSAVPFSAGAGNFSLNHRVQNASGAHPAF
jgi:hypothetical protein